MNSAASPDIDALRAALAAAEARADEAEARAARMVAEASNAEAIIAALKLMIEKLRRELYGQRSERKARLLDQLELKLEELEASATEDEFAAEQAAAKTSTVKAFTRRRPSRKPFPAHLPRERVVVPAPEVCGCCGSDRLAKLGEDVTETLEVIPRQWKVIQTVREKFTCRDCEKISQAPAPFHVTPRGWAGPSLLAMILFEKYGQHQPLNRQSERYAREGVELSLSTLADQVGACAAVLRPLHSLIQAHVLAAERIHGDDTTVPVLAKGKTDVARAWVYVRDDLPFGGADPPAALFYYSRDRSGAHPEKHLKAFSGILQADAYAGYNRLYEPDRSPGPLTKALCWSHARRKFFVLADIASKAKKGEQGAVISPLAFEAVRRIDALFDIEREINGMNADERLAVRAERSAPLFAELEAWMREELPRPWTTCSSAGRALPGSSRTAASA
jgi:transposase